MMSVYQFKPERGVTTLLLIDDHETAAGTQDTEDVEY